MYKIGDVVMYRQNVCRLEKLAKKFRDDKDFYVLEPLSGVDLTVFVPIDACDQIRPIISRRGAEKLIDRIGEIDAIEDGGGRALEGVYKNLLKSPDLEDLVKIIKTAYLRGEEKIEKGQSRSEKDKIFFRKAENALYSELAVVLGKSVEDTRAYVVDRVEALKS